MLSLKPWPFVQSSFDIRGTGLPNPSRETKFLGANTDREMFIFPVELTTCRIGNLTRLIHILAIIINDTLARSLEPVVTECKEHTIHTQTQVVASRKLK